MKSEKFVSHADILSRISSTDKCGERLLPAFMKFARTVKSHWNGIVHFVESRLSNGILEGINHKVQLAKRRARGFRNIDNFINMIYFLCGKLKFDYPRYFI